MRSHISSIIAAILTVAWSAAAPGPGAQATTPTTPIVDYHTFVINAFDPGRENWDYDSWVGFHYDKDGHYQFVRDVAAAKMGMHIQMKTHLFEPDAKRVFDWEHIWRFDNMMQTHYNLGAMPMWGNLCGMPKWSSGRYDEFWWQAGVDGPEQQQDFIDMLRFWVKRYRYLVKVWEIWNEPMWSFQWNSTDPPADYARTLVSSYAEIKGLDPDAIVMTGGIPTVLRPPPYVDEFRIEPALHGMFTELIRLNKLDQAFDMWGYHGSTGSQDPEAWATTLTLIQDIVTSYIVTPAANTESHSLVARRDVTRDLQGIVDVRICQQHRSLLDCQLYDTWPGQTNYWPSQDARYFGLFDENGQTNEKYDHMSTLAKAMDRTVFDGLPTHDGPDTVHLFRWRREGEYLITAYDLAGSHPLTVDGIPVSSVETWGPKGQNRRTLPVTNGRLSFTVTDGWNEGTTYIYYTLAGAATAIDLDPARPSLLFTPRRSLNAGSDSELTLRAVLRDANGHCAHAAQNPVTFAVTGGGGGVLIGPNPATPVDGVATIRLRAGAQASAIRVSASTAGLTADNAEVTAFNGWSDFQVARADGTWVDGSQTLSRLHAPARVRVEEPGVGLRGSLAGYQVSHDGGASWVGNDEFNGLRLSSAWTAAAFNDGAGTATLSGGQLIISGAGLDVWAPRDDFFAVHRRVAGNFECIVKIDEQQDTHPWAKAGLMLRNRLATSPDNGYVTVLAAPQAGYAMQRDSDRNGYIDANNNFSLNDPPDPCYLKLIKRAPYIAGYVSTDTDGRQWKLLDVRRVDDAQEHQFLCLFATSMNPDQTSAVKFDYVRFWQLTDVNLPEHEYDGAYELTVQASELGFRNFSETQNLIRFSVPDMFYQRSYSPAYAVKSNAISAARPLLWQIFD